MLKLRTQNTNVLLFFIRKIMRLSVDKARICQHEQYSSWVTFSWWSEQLEELLTTTFWFHDNEKSWGTKNSWSIQLHCKQIFTRFLDFFLPNLSGTGTGYIIPGQGEFGKWHYGWGWEYRKTFFYSLGHLDPVINTVFFFWLGDQYSWGIWLRGSTHLGYLDHAINTDEIIWAGVQNTVRMILSGIQYSWETLDHFVNTIRIIGSGWIIQLGKFDQAINRARLCLDHVIHTAC